MTFARAYISGEDYIVYQLLFSRLFALINNRASQQARWQYLTRDQGFKAVIMDMGPGQLKGLKFVPLNLYYYSY